MQTNPWVVESSVMYVSMKCISAFGYIYIFHKSLVPQVPNLGGQSRCLYSFIAQHFWFLRRKANLEWSWLCLGGSSRCVCTVLQPRAPAQSEDWNTGLHPKTVLWPKGPASGGAQDLVDHLWQHQLEDSYKCSQKSKCWRMSVGWWSGDKVLPDGESWSTCRQW